jgi:glyoxylase-like metal-dependent hydrolase (beta-lactamase superfamily II)
MPESVDLHFLGHASVIGTAILKGPDGVALIDPGPSTTVAALEAGLAACGVGFGDVRALLLTHIHLDHCGGTGTIVAAHPHIEVYVHERGAPHLADPAKLIASATRLYKDDMARLWGAILPVPAARVHALGERTDIAIAGRTLEAVWTPGHASHHVCYLDATDHTAFTGDTAGMCRPGHTEVVPPALPPELDLVAWRHSTDRLLAWHPRTLFLTHFGSRHDPEAHMDRLWRRLDDWSTRVRTSLRDPGTDDEKATAFAEAARKALADRSTPEDAAAHALAAPFALSWQGLARYWRKQ